MYKNHYKLLVCLMVFFCLIILPTSFAADADTVSIDDAIMYDDSLDFVDSVDNEDSLDSLDIGDEMLESSESENDNLKADYYFNSNANKDGNGTEGNPYKYLNKSRIQNNSVIHLANGVYELELPATYTNISIIGQSFSNTIINCNSGTLTLNGNLAFKNIKLVGQKASKSIINVNSGILTLSGYVSFKDISLVGQGASQSSVESYFRTIYAYNDFILQNISLLSTTIENKGNLKAYNVIFANNKRFSSNANYGGAIYSLANNYTVYLKNCSFYNNSAQYGGAIYLGRTNAEIIDCEFINNSATELYGGAIFSESDLAGGSNLTIRNTKFINDKSIGDAGGALYLKAINFNGFNLTVSNCSSTFGGAFTFLNSSAKIAGLYGINNTASYDGGVIYQMYGNLTVSNSTFESNDALNGAGLFISSAQILSIYNNTFKDNSASLYGGAIAYLFNNYTNIKDNIYESNHASNPDCNNLYTYSNIDLVFYDNDYAMYIYNLTDNPLPTYYSSVDEGYVTSVKDQGSGGNCWSFATIATLESCILKASGEEIDLSEENMKNLASLYSIFGWKMETNDGGYAEMGLGYLLSWLGPVLEDVEIYNPQSQLSPVLSSIMHVQNILFLKRDSYTDNDMIKRAIRDYGAVFTPVYMSSKTDSNIGTYVYNDDTSKRNHAVTLVGWDDGIAIPGAPGKGAWIVKNSWGPRSGNDGYFYLSYYDQSSVQLGTWGDAWTFILNDTIKYDKNYQYDIARTDYLFNATNTVWYKNIFTANDNEYLSAVSTYFEKPSNWELSVYVNNALKATKSGFSNPGYWTIDLSELIPLNVGDIFEIVFKIKVNGDAGVPISEKVSLNHEYYKEGISFISYDGKKWKDLYDLVWAYPDHTYKSQVACIKAFTILDLINTTTSLEISNLIIEGNSYNPVNMTVTVLSQYGNPINCGVVLFNISNTIIPVNVSNGIAKLSYNFNRGTSFVIATFVACGYNSSSNSSIVENIIKYDASMVMSDMIIDFDTAIVNITLNESINETVYFILPYKTVHAKTIDGKVSVNLTDLKAGLNNLRIVLDNRLYDCNEIVYNFTIKDYKTKIILKDLETIYTTTGKAYKIKLTDEDGNPLIGKELEYTLNGITKTLKTDKNGEITITISLKAGTYKLNVNFKGISLYNKSSNSASIIIKTTIFPSNYNNYTYGSKYNIKFLDKNYNPLKNTNVVVVFAGKTYNLKTNANGLVSINNYLKAGTYAVKIKNPNTLEEITKNIKVVNRIGGNKDLTMYYGAGSYYKVRAFDDHGGIAKNVTVKFTLNGKNYYIKTNNQGYASIKINFKPKTYAISATYKGFTVKNKVTVKSTIITSNISKKKAKIIKFTSKLLNSKGAILKYKYITFKFKGKKYKRMTNKNGIATLSLKNLKKGKYAIYSTYGKLTIKNTLTVK